MYVSCRYTTPPAIVCTDDNGVEWSLIDTSEVGDYLRFVEDGGVIEPAAVPVDANITAVPDTLFGGKSIREALSGQ